MTFRDINTRFGGLDVAIVGIEVEDAYAGSTLERLGGLTASLLSMPDLDHVLSLTNVDDFAPDPLGGIRTARLVESIPLSRRPPRARGARPDRGVLGTLVSTTARPSSSMPFRPTERTPGRGHRDRDCGARALPDAGIHLGGAVRVAVHLRHHAGGHGAPDPWAVLAIVVILLVAFRNIRAVALGLLSTGTGILGVHATMSVLDIPLNVVLGSMPVILFAVGSAAIHMLARYSVHGRVMPARTP